eukprot:UN18779
MFYNWNEWLSCPDPHFHIYIENGSMHSKKNTKIPPKLFFQIVKDNLKNLYMEETKWDMNNLYIKHFNGTRKNPDKTGKNRYLREIRSSEENNVQGATRA